MIDTSMLSLDVRFQPRAQAWAECMTAYVLVLRFPGYKMRTMETRRTLARQADLESSGPSRLKVGFHNFGLALDFAIFDPTGQYLKDDGTHAYEACGQVAEGFGMEWGGRWASFRDYGHIQYRPDGITLDALIRAAGLTA